MSKEIRTDRHSIVKACMNTYQSRLTLEYLSNWKVKTGLRMAALNRSLNTPAEKYKSAGGTTSNTRVRALAINIARRGPTTVVLPAPIIIYMIDIHA